MESNYGALASESNDTWEKKVVVEKKPLSRTLTSIVALVIACIGIAVLVSNTKHYTSISKSKSITSLSKVTYASDSFTHAPTPSKYDDDLTRAPTPKNLHPTLSPVEEKNNKKRLLKTPTYFGKETFNPTPSAGVKTLNPTPINFVSVHPTEEPSEKKSSNRDLKSSKKSSTLGINFVETVPPTPTYFGKETFNPTPSAGVKTLNPTPINFVSVHPTEEPSEKSIHKSSK